MKWSTLSEISARVITPIVFILMARLLTPADYGVTASVMVILSFAQVFWDAGLGRALIQRENNIEKAANVVFWTNLGLAAVVYVALFLGAGLISRYLFKDPRIVTVIRVQGLIVLVNAFACVQTAHFQRNLDFKSLFWVRLITTGAPALASLPLAACGFGYWALVAGTLTGAIVQAIVLWRFSPWRPSFEYDREVAREMVRFGMWVTVSGMLAWFYSWGDILLVGAYFDTRTLGLYRTGSTFVLTVFAMALGPIIPVVYAMLARMQGDLPRVRTTFLRVVRTIFLVAAPLGAMLFITRFAASYIIFGTKWSGVEVVIGWYALFTGLSWLVGSNNEVYRAVGLPAWETKSMLFGLATHIPVYFLTVNMGFGVFVKARFFLVFIGITWHLYLLSRILQIHARDVLFEVRHILIGFVVMIAVSLAITEWTSYSALTQGLIAAPVAALAYLVIAFTPKSASFKEVSGVIKALRSSRKRTA